MARPFHEVLAELGAGMLLGQLSDATAEVVKAVQETEKKGTLTLTLTFVPNKGTIVTQPEIKTKAPKGTLPASIHFADDDGSLCREDPKQPDMFGGRNIRSVQ